MKFQIEFDKEKFEQKCKLYYGDQLIYTGYVDNLITSINGYLEVKLNYTTSRTSSMIVKKLGDNFFWLPINYQNVNENYNNIIVSANEMKILWDKLGYDLADDIGLISRIRGKELKLLWIANSGLRPFDNFDDIVDRINKNIILTSNESSDLDTIFNYLLEKNWDNLELNCIQLIDSIQDKLTVYIDYSNRLLEWVPLVKESTQYCLINLGNNWGIKLISYNFRL